ncbi:MAG: SGNH/GDSL hydrolase family protein, partial [Burkholderiales bacterium]
DYDGSHPDVIGTYLAACVVYASLYGKSAVGNSYDYYGKVDRDTTTFLQNVADETVRKFFGR